MAHSAKKTEKMRKQSIRNLKAIAESGSLSSDAAQYEINRRASENKS